MPTLSNINLPTPKSWEEFEEISLDALRIKWDSPNLQRHGRQGQQQAGVDIYGDDYLSQIAGVQCKKYDTDLTLKIIEDEVKNAESFDPPLDVFYIATTFPTDATLQKQIRLISKKRRGAGKFPVGIFFWNDIVQELVTNEKILKKHFPQISVDSFQSKKTKRLFSLLELSFHGLNLKHYSDVLYGEFGFLAQEDPRKMEIICSIIESACIVTCSNEEQVKIKTKIDHFLNYLMPIVTGQKKDDSFNWKISDDNAERVGGLIKSVEHSLIGDELLVFRIGELIGNWNRFEFEKKDETPVSDEFLTTLTGYISKLNSGTLPSAIKDLIDKYKNDHLSTSQATIADKVFLKLKQILIETELTQL
jgi:hypothetical protein